MVFIKKIWVLFGLFLSGTDVLINLGRFNNNRLFHSSLAINHQLCFVGFAFGIITVSAPLTIRNHIRSIKNKPKRQASFRRQQQEGLYGFNTIRNMLDKINKNYNNKKSNRNHNIKINDNGQQRENISKIDNGEERENFSKIDNGDDDNQQEIIIERDGLINITTGQLIAENPNYDNPDNSDDDNSDSDGDGNPNGNPDNSDDDQRALQSNFWRGGPQSAYLPSNPYYNQPSNNINDGGRPLPTIGVGASFKEALFAPGDIPLEWRQLVRNTPLSAFSGKWEAILTRSDSLDTILAALGVVPLKRRIMEQHRGVTEVTIMDSTNSVVRMRNYLPHNIVVGANVPLNGEVFLNQEKETGSWVSRAFFVNGRLGQSRTSAKGTMYDVRAVFSSDPEGLYLEPGPVMLFRWTFIPTSGSNVFTVNRWLRRVLGSVQ